MLRREGGCLLADDVGTGKTYVALAIAREWQRPLVVVPASLRSTWEHAMRCAAVSCGTTTHESLSRGTVPAGPFDGIIVDESHRFRPTSNRHAALARLASRTPLLLLSATPLQNRARELAAQVALFIGEAAYALDPAALTRWIVRATSDVDRVLPAVAPPHWAHSEADDGAVLEALLALPPPPRAADAGDGGALLLLSLSRAWASSRAALVATIRRRRRSLVALEQCHAEGRVPTTRELTSWQGGDAVQLGFPTMLAATIADRSAAAQHARAMEAERCGLDAVMRAIDRAPDPDMARVRALRAICTRHGDVAILAFSEFASTVRAYFTAMRADRGVGMLTANEARIASGRLSRVALLARFAPRAQGAPTPHPRERLALLLATDLLSEGVNLQDAAVVVHLDLPWNPARLAQRLGRIRRPGGASEVASYLVAPPARSTLLLRAERRLRDKLAQAERTIGRGLDVLPALSADAAHEMATGVTQSSRPAASPLAVAELRGEIHRLLARWRQEADAISASERTANGPSIAAARAAARGWVAVLDDGRLVTSLRDDQTSADCDGGATEVVALLLHALRCADGAARSANEAESLAARQQLEQWIAHDWAHRSCFIAPLASPVRQRTLRRIEAALRAVPRHRLRSALSVASSLRAALEGRLTLGMERAVDDLPDDQDGARWLARAAALFAVCRDRDASREGDIHAPRVRAIILLGPDPA